MSSHAEISTSEHGECEKAKFTVDDLKPSFRSTVSLEVELESQKKSLASKALCAYPS